MGGPHKFRGGKQRVRCLDCKKFFILICLFKRITNKKYCLPCSYLRNLASKHRREARDKKRSSKLGKTGRKGRKEKARKKEKT